MRIAMAQMLVEGGRLEANLERAEGCVLTAHLGGAHAVVLPECLDLGWMHDSARTRAEPIPGATVDALCRWARRHRIVVVAGITERAGGELYNAAVVIDADGRIARKHRKLNELDVGQSLYRLGCDLAVAETSIGRIGLAICADLSPGANDIGRALALMRAQVILSPAAWFVPPDHDAKTNPYGAMWRQSYGDISRRFGVPVVGVSNVGTLDCGPWAGWKGIGSSIAYDHAGECAAELPYGVTAEALRIVELTPAPARPPHHW
jgi:predicted amidohydrolase